MALRDQRFGSTGFEGYLEQVYDAANDQEPMPKSMLFRDPPDHTRLRGLVNRAFTPRVVEGLRPRIAEIVGALLDRVEPARAMEVIADLAYPLPVTVISEMLGVPEADRDSIKLWSMVVLLEWRDSQVLRGLRAPPVRF